MDYKNFTDEELKTSIENDKKHILLSIDLALKNQLDIDIYSSFKAIYGRILEKNFELTKRKRNIDIQIFEVFPIGGIDKMLESYREKLIQAIDMDLDEDSLVEYTTNTQLHESNVLDMYKTIVDLKIARNRRIQLKEEKKKDETTNG